MSYGGKSSSGSQPAANGYQPTQPAQQKFTSQIAQPLQHAAPSAATARLSGALAGSPSWMTPPAAHTPFQLPANLPGIQHPAIQNPGLSGSIFNGSKPVNIAQTMAPTPKPAPQPINQIAQPPQQGTMNPQPTAPAPGGGMTALAPGNLPPPAQPGPGQALNPDQLPGVQNVLSQHPGWTYHGMDIRPSWGGGDYQDAQGNEFNADGTPWQNPAMVNPGQAQSQAPGPSLTGVNPQLLSKT